MRLLLYTGKGGAGKTTCAAATAVRAAEGGRKTLVVSADAAHSLGDVLEVPLGPEPVRVAPNLDAVELDARVEISRHWGAVREFLVSIFRYQGIDGVVAEELAMLPGAEEIATLLGVEERAAAGEHELIVVDCAPTDAALRLVTLPEVIHRSLRLLLPVMRAISGVATPIARRLVSVPLPGSEVFRDIDELVFSRLLALQQRITGPETSVRIVVTPERMVIDEARRAWTELSLFEVPCDAVVMNRLLPPEAADDDFFRDWMRVQEERRAEVEELFAPLPLLASPLGRDEVTGVARLAEHGRLIFGEREPGALLSRAPRVRFERRGDDYVALVPMPGARADELDVVKVDDELKITAGSHRRSLVLPRRMAALPLAGARIDGPSLVVRFGPQAATAGVD